MQKKVISDKLNQFQIFHFDEIDSTNNEALRKIKNNAIFEKAIIISNNQTNGRGKKDAIWISCEGNIFLSIVYRIENLVQNFENLSILVAEVLKQIIESNKNPSLNFECKIKFPNDLLINGKKVAGILPELHNFDNKYFLIIGIGINWENSPNENFDKIGNLVLIEKNKFIEELVLSLDTKITNLNFL